MEAEYYIRNPQAFPAFSTLELTNQATVSRGKYTFRYIKSRDTEGEVVNPWYYH